MNEDSPPPPARRRIDSSAKARFLDALRRGERREDAADACGFSLTGFYNAPHRDPAFAAEWKAALAASAAAERRKLAYELRGSGPERGEIRIARANRRFYQRRRRRNVRFDAAAQEVFLACFVQDCDTKAAAAAAGVHESTVHLHCRTDRAFAEAYAAALAEGYVRLEAEALRQRLAAQARLRATVESADIPPRACLGEGDHAEHGGGATSPHATPCPHCAEPTKPSSTES